MSRATANPVDSYTGPASAYLRLRQNIGQYTNTLKSEVWPGKVQKIIYSLILYTADNFSRYYPVTAGSQNRAVRGEVTLNGNLGLDNNCDLGAHW